MKISLDRVTVCGNAYGDVESFIANELAVKRRSMAQYPYRDTIHFLDGSVLQFGEINAVRSGKIKELRYDFNPNNKSYEKLHMRVLQIMKDAHFTRLDIALDVRDVDMGKWKWVDSQSRPYNVWYSGNGEIETWYVGGKDSEMRIRIYNKAKEQKLKDEKWWRVEIQLRGNVAQLYGMWMKKAEIEVNPFEHVTPVVNGDFPELDIKKRSMVKYLIDYPSGFSELSPNSRREYKKTLRMIASWECIDFYRVWKEKIPEVQSEIVEWFNFTKQL